MMVVFGNQLSCIIHPLFNPIPTVQPHCLDAKELLMKLRIFLPLCVMCALLLVACARQDETTNRASSSSTPVASSATPAAPATTAPGDKIGVPECDDFIAAYDACVSSKVPETARAQYKSAIEQWRSGWKRLAENPQTKPTLASACKQTIEQARASMKSYNCTF